ncbi:MAG: type II toxin-antitoxin system RelE/ParE family toxin [Pyrinomonadaceae bacterium]
MIGYRFLSVAEEEMILAAQFYDGERSGLGSRFLEEIYSAIDRICRFSEIGTPISNRLRSVVLYRFPYSLIYYIDVDTIVVTVVAHQSRRPNYWKDRIS